MPNRFDIQLEEQLTPLTSFSVPLASIEEEELKLPQNRFNIVPFVKQIRETIPRRIEAFKEGGIVEVGKQVAEEFGRISPEELAVSFAPIGGLKAVLPQEIIETASSKLVNAIKIAKPLRSELQTAYTLERSKRAVNIEEIFTKESGEEAYKKALGELKGALVEQRPKFEPVKAQLAQTDVDDLFKQIQTREDMDIFQKITTSNGLTKLLEGDIPQPSQLVLLEEVFGQDLIKSVLSKRALGAKIEDIVTEALNIPRALMTTLDMSAPFRQGLILTVAKPKQALGAFREMFRQVFSQKNYEAWFDNLKKDSANKLMQDSGLYISNPNRIAGGLSAREESFMTNLAQRIPVVGPIIKASERAYTSFLNKLRVDTFKDLSSKFIKDGLDPVSNKDVFESLADFVNNATGRGNLGKLARNAQSLNSLFFSPRLIAARFNMLNPKWYFDQPLPVRKEAIKAMGRFIGTGVTILSLAKLAGTDVEIDPRSSDFGKIKVGNVRWDIWGGFQQWARFFTQLLTGERKSLKTGKIIEFSQKKFPFETRLDLISNFFQGKFAPIPSLVTDILRGQPLFGGELDLKKEFVERVMPIYFQDIAESWEELGPAGLLEIGGPAFFGVGVQRFIPREKTRANRFDI